MDLTTIIPALQAGAIPLAILAIGGIGIAVTELAGKLLRRHFAIPVQVQEVVEGEVVGLPTDHGTTVALDRRELRAALAAPSIDVLA